MTSEASFPQISLVVKFVFASRTLVCLSTYMYIIWCTYGLTTNTMPTRIVCAHSHLFLTLHRGNQITIETESERARDCTQKFIKDKYTLFISTRATLLQRYLSAYNNDIVSNELFFFHSVSTSNGLQQIPLISLRSPINVLHFVLVYVYSYIFKSCDSYNIGVWMV